jgi:competence protein ComEA
MNVKIILIVVLLTLGYLYGMSKLEVMHLTDLAHIPTTSQGESTTIVTPTDENLQVTISGAVVNPGKYQLARGDSLEKLISLAGGLSTEADESCYQLGYIIQDSASIYIAQENGGNKISINTGNLDALSILPGIGSVIAQRVIDYRQSHGPFQCIDDIRKVSGIGEAIFAKIRELIRL